MISEDYERNGITMATKKIVYAEPAAYFPESVLKELEKNEKKETAKKTVKKAPKSNKE